EVTVRDCKQAPAEGADVVVYDAAGVEAGRGVADADGRVALRVPKDATVTALAPLGPREGGSAPTLEEKLTVGICPGATVLGRVVDRAGNPAPGTRVVLGADLDEAEADERGEFVLTDVDLLATGLSAVGP